MSKEESKDVLDRDAGWWNKGPDPRMVASVMGMLAALAAVTCLVVVPLNRKFGEMFNAMDPGRESSPASMTDFIFAAITSWFFGLAALSLWRRHPWGKRLAQAAVIVVVSLNTFVVAWHKLDGLRTEKIFGPGPTVSLISLWWILPLVGLLYLVVRYLGRMQIEETGFIAPPVNGANLAPVPAAPVKYRHSLFWLGPIGLFVAIMIAFLTGMNYIFFEMREFSPLVMVAFFAFVFIGPILHSYFSSPFSKSREIISSYFMGGTVGLLQTPFNRLLVYKDGLEVRSMFSCMFIPYERMEDPPDASGLFSWGLIIKSDLPGVPWRIRLSSLFRNQAIVDEVIEIRDRYLKEKTPLVK
jgi:hypothetical protein